MARQQLVAAAFGVVWVKSLPAWADASFHQPLSRRNCSVYEEFAAAVRQGLCACRESSDWYPSAESDLRELPSVRVVKRLRETRGEIEG